MTLIQKEMLAKAFIILCALIILLLTAAIAFPSYKSVTELKTFEPIQVVVMSTSMTKHRRSRGGFSYCPHIKVQYIFQNTRYLSELQIDDMQCRPIVTATMNRISKYLVGSKIDALINPNDPSIIRDLNYDLSWGFYGLIFIMALSVFMIIYAVKSRVIKHDMGAGTASQGN